VEHPSVPLIPFLYFGVAFLLTAAVLGYHWRRVRTIRNLPLTPLDAFHTPEAQLEPGVMFRPRLSRLGRTAVVFAVAFGIVGAGVTVATLFRIASDDPGAEDAQVTAPTVVGASKREKRHIVRMNRPAAGRVPRAARLIALVPAGLIDFGVGVLLWSLRRHLLLVRRGRLTTGHVVAILGYGRGAVAYYDFRNDQGGVTRGSSSLQFPLYAQVFVGSALPLLYMPDDPGFNRLRTSLLWEIPDCYEVV
jgi:hypothetical protein